MKQAANISPEQVSEVFTTLGISTFDVPALSDEFGINKIDTNDIIFTRLSSSSVPPPTGVTINANLEGTT